MQLGDKVLVEGSVIGMNRDVNKVRVHFSEEIHDGCNAAWVKPSLIRPWTEKPSPHEVWRKEMNGTTYVVHSDGLVWKHADADGEMTSPAESVPTGDEMLEVLAEYVRQKSR